MFLQRIVARRFYTSNRQQPSTQHNRTSRHLGLVALLCCLLVILAACGPERCGDEADLTGGAIRNAQEYEQDGDLNRARSQLQGLDAANPTQWLIYLAETRVAEQPGAAETDSLVWLAMGLGLQSRPLVEYATANNLLVNPPPTLAPQAQAPVDAVAPAAVSPAAPPTPAPAVEPSSSTATTDTATTGTGASVTETTTADATPAAAAAPVATTSTKPMAQASSPMNVRSGPGIAYPLAGAINPGELVEIIGKNPQSDWWQVLLPSGQQGWVYGPLVQTAGDTTAVAVAANIPEPPPTATPAPVAAAPTTAPAEQPPAEQPPADAPPAEAPPEEQAPPPADPSGTPHFSLVDKRLWSKAENGDCRGQHLLRLHVVDANGNRLNGVTLQGIYVGEILVTGAQGKGDGIIEYDLHGSGEGFRVIRDADGRDATSDNAEGFTTRSRDIPTELLIPAGYCSNAEDCQIFYNSYGCQGHHSWEATLKRNY